MLRRWWWLCLASACGRVGFGDARPGADATRLDDASGHVAPTAGLVAYWPFDEGSGDAIDDASGNDHRGKLFGGATWAAGVRGGAILLDGTDGCAAVPTDALLSTWGAAPMTLATWISDDTPAAQLGNSMWHRIITWHDASGLDHVLGLGTATNDVDRAFFIGTASATTNDNDASVGAAPLGWHHVAGTFDGTTLHVYVDGAAAGGGGLDNSIEQASDTSKLFIGQKGDSTRYVHGLLDDMRIYDRALSPAEIAELYLATGGT